VESEKERLGKEIVYLQGFLRSVDAKLSNERFVQNAKEEVVEVERRKKEDALSKLKILEAALNSLESN
jgi:valyl-tRNA synthetase